METGSASSRRLCLGCFLRISPRSDLLENWLSSLIQQTAASFQVRAQSDGKISPPVQGSSSDSAVSPPELCSK